MVLEQFEAGENITDQVCRSPQAGGVVVSVRLSPEDSAKLLDLAEEGGKSMSQVAGEAVHFFVSERTPGKIEKLEYALRNLPYSAYREAMEDGCGPSGAWDFFVEECHAHVVKALEEAG